MAAKSVIEVALANIDANIAVLQRARDIIVSAAKDAPEDAPKVKRGRKPKSRGLPTTSDPGE